MSGWLVLLVTLSASSSDPATHAVICAETGFSRAAEARDAAAFLSYVDPDARFVTGEVARGHEEIRASWSVFLAADGPAIRWRPAVVEVSADGRLALSRGPYRTLSVDTDGQPRESWGHYISTWRLGDDGRWRILFDTGADTGMTPSAADRETLLAEPDCG